MHEPYRLLEDTDFIRLEFVRGSHDTNGKSYGEYFSSYPEVEAEMRRLKLELKQTTDMYNIACKEALREKRKARDLHRWKMELEEQRKEEDAVRLAEEVGHDIASAEKAEKATVKCKAANIDAEMMFVCSCMDVVRAWMLFVRR